MCSFLDRPNECHLLDATDYLQQKKDSSEEASIDKMQNRNCVMFSPFLFSYFSICSFQNKVIKLIQLTNVQLLKFPSRSANTWKASMLVAYQCTFYGFTWLPSPCSRFPPVNRLVFFPASVACWGSDPWASVKCRETILIVKDSQNKDELNWMIQHQDAALLIFQFH